ncbi:DUF927 domain-containing protein [Staphylococcus haemolyticus]|uniref:DUF927 domain-containing protein n=1 Tax=Staphylococcus haemolyticus TaxID=1283 RepID=UPI001F0AAD5B|nr:DUF927 domain-containing protein [Staphylococcus haemolyticus]MCH4420256.1 DUF927 domain-containing protein [Staphylococcus haemolyticus]
MNFTNDEIMNEINKSINKKTYTPDFIPDGYKVKTNQYGAALYQIIPSKKDGEPDQERFITTTIPEINTRYENIEDGKVSYNMHFIDNRTPVNLSVTAEEITDNRQLLKLANRKLDVTSNTSSKLVDYINQSKRYSPPINIKVATRLGHVKDYFIYPYKDEMEHKNIKFFNNDKGFQKLVNSFKSKGTIEDYSKKVFVKIKDLPMVMVMLYASLGSVLLYEFDIKPFIVELAGSTSTGKTFTLNLVASVWGTTDLTTTWSSTRNSIEAMAAFLNSFPIFKDDTRNTSPAFVSRAVYNYSSGESKSRSNKNLTVDEKKEWKNILLSTGEASITNMEDDKAGVSARVITLEEQPYPDKFDFISLDREFRENYGTLGIEFIKEFQSKKYEYKNSFESYLRYFNDKGMNEVMQRIGKCFALLQLTGEILNDIDGFEHDYYKIISQAYENMLKNNKTIDKPKQVLEGLLEYLDANRNSIIGDGYGPVKNGEIKAVYKHDYLCIKNETVKTKLGYETQTITSQWEKKGYLITDKKRLQKQVKHNSERHLGYAIKKSIVEELGFDFSVSHNPYTS